MEEMRDLYVRADAELLTPQILPWLHLFQIVIPSRHPNTLASLLNSL